MITLAKNIWTHSSAVLALHWLSDADSPQQGWKLKPQQQVDDTKLVSMWINAINTAIILQARSHTTENNMWWPSKKLKLQKKQLK